MYQPPRIDAARIIREVHAALEREPRVNLHRYPLRIECVGDGSLILEGETESLAAKKIALELAASVQGPTGIVDRLRVAPAERMGDGAIRDHVRDALLEESALEECEIRVREDSTARTVREAATAQGNSVEVAVDDGVVTLNGRVDSLSHKRFAGLLAWWVPGTRDVVNGIEVAPAQADSDDEITDAALMALEKDPFVNETSVRASTRNSVVTLEGVVVNQRQKKIAEADVWYIFGVDGVINRLRTLE